MRSLTDGWIKYSEGDDWGGEMISKHILSGWGFLNFPYIVIFNKQVVYTHANNDCFILFLHWQCEFEERESVLLRGMAW